VNGKRVEAELFLTVHVASLGHEEAGYSRFSGTVSEAPALG